VLDVTQYPFVILRAGAVSVEDIVKTGAEVVAVKKKELLKRSPGTRYRHYAPDAKVILIDSGAATSPEGKSNLCRKAAYMGTDKPESDFTAVVIFKSKAEYARLLFATFRYFDALGIDAIFAQMPDEKGIGLAIRDRLKRAAE
jgi:L-threonylcarbamoyladenylate synthase